MARTDTSREFWANAAALTTVIGMYAAGTVIETIQEHKAAMSVVEMFKNNIDKILTTGIVGIVSIGVTALLMVGMSKGFLD